MGHSLYRASIATCGKTDVNENGCIIAEIEHCEWFILIIFDAVCQFVCCPGYRGKIVPGKIVPTKVQYVYASPRVRTAVVVNSVQTFTAQIIFSIFVCLCCNPLFGLIALILAGGIRELSLLYKYFEELVFMNVLDWNV